jgi:hypothetical protein
MTSSKKVFRIFGLGLAATLLLLSACVATSPYEQSYYGAYSSSGVAPSGSYEYGGFQETFGWPSGSFIYSSYAYPNLYPYGGGYLAPYPYVPYPVYGPPIIINQPPPGLSRDLLLLSWIGSCGAENNVASNIQRMFTRSLVYLKSVQFLLTTTRS